MINMHYLFATAEAQAEGSSNILTSLGIDWKLFVGQTIAFAILLGILAKFVYPVLIKSIDQRRETIEAGLNEAKEAQEALAKAESKVEQLLADARKEADEIVARSHGEAQAMVAEAEAKAKQRAERIVADARNQLDAEVVKARAALKKDTLQLVALATEKIVGEKLDATKDAKMIEKAIAEGSRA
jgi:F-type H+-transporting ATPase subunit b